MSIKPYALCMFGIVQRELLRFVNQKSRFISALVRPLLWLIVFAAGFKAALGITLMEPYETYINYQEYILPGLCCMVILFNSMQSSLSMVYDRETGSMKVFRMSPFPHSFLLFCKLFASSLVSIMQVYVFLLLALLLEFKFSFLAYAYLFPLFILIAFFLSSLGIVLTTFIRQLENFAGVMNFVIFPMFFLSSALYPLWKMKEASLWLFWLCQYNPFTFCVELVRFGLFQKLNTTAFIVVFSCCMFCCVIALIRYRKI